MPTLQEIDQWAGILFQIAGALAAVAVFIGAFTVIFEYRKGVRDAIRLKQEQWRISYRNLNLTHSSILTNRASAPVVRSSPSATPIGRKISPDISPSERKTSVAPQTEDSQFLIFQLELENIGDGPVDVWACFVAARELNAGDHREAWGGNIEWNDLVLQ